MPNLIPLINITVEFRRLGIDCSSGVFVKFKFVIKIGYSASFRNGIRPGNFLSNS